MYGAYTRTVTVFHHEKALVEEYAKRVQKAVRQKGYAVRLETMNAMDAFVGSLPGHSVQNLRAVLLHTLNLADLLPTTSTWSGQETVANPFFPKHSPALLLGSTAGKSPFFLSPYYGDVGHCLLLGPSGAGKTTLLNMVVAQYGRYPKARVFAFDNKYGMYALCRAMGGWHLDVGGMDRVGIVPWRAWKTNANASGPLGG
jgi:type IV secretion system protein VirB4